MQGTIKKNVYFINADTYYRAVHYINGFSNGKSYFNQWRFSDGEKDQLFRGEVVEKDGNSFHIEISNESNHIEKPCDVLKQEIFEQIAF